jgi:hypothetical protein
LLDKAHYRIVPRQKNGSSPLNEDFPRKAQTPAGVLLDVTCDIHQINLRFNALQRLKQLVLFFLGDDLICQR